MSEVSSVGYLNLYRPNHNSGRPVSWQPLGHQEVDDIHDIASQTSTNIQPYIGFQISGNQAQIEQAQAQLERFYAGSAYQAVKIDLNA